ncbi:MAG: hypothetical protein R3B68_01905 [Phycisphaerales bacterium]
MKPFTMLLCCAAPCLALLAGAAATATPQTQAKAQSQPAARDTAPPIVNANCPVAGSPIDGTTFVEFEGVRVGFCCPGCDSRFEGWDAQRKRAFIAEARAAQPHDDHHEDHGDHAAGDDEHMPLVFAFYLPDCPLMGREIDPERAVVKEFEGREIRLCCTRCERRFDSDPAAAFEKVDELMIADQLPLYPITDCLVMEGHELGDDAINMVYKNRLVRLCCEGCVADFEADPEAYLHRLDQAAAEAQRETYPLAECVVAGHEIADGEEPTELIVAGRLVRLCCPDCMGELLRNPAQYIAMIDEARAAQAEAAEHAGDGAAPATRGR